jgi:hypothetical protein
LVGEYSYDGDAVFCTQADPADTQIDPITVVARLHYHTFFPDRYASDEEDSWEGAAEHLMHHGWNEGRDTGQYFREGAGCALGEISLAESTAPFGAEQWHARGHQQRLANDPYHPHLPAEQFGATLTAMTPHFDESAQDVFPPYDGCGFIDHYVEEDYDPRPEYGWSGFDRAREQLVTEWLDDSDQHHVMVQSQFWNNRQRQQQCNGDLTRHSGYVYHIGLCEAQYPC